MALLELSDHDNNFVKAIEHKSKARNVISRRLRENVRIGITSVKILVLEYNCLTHNTVPVVGLLLLTLKTKVEN